MLRHRHRYHWLVRWEEGVLQAEEFLGGVTEPSEVIDGDWHKGVVTFGDSGDCVSLCRGGRGGCLSGVCFSSWT